MDMKQKLWKTPLALLVVFGMAACGKDDGPAPDPPGNGGDEVTPESVTYTNYVGSLLQSACSSCHTGNGEGVAFWTFSGYPSVSSNLARINDVVIVRKVMPKNGSLSSRQLELLKAWIDKGAPQ